MYLCQVTVHFYGNHNYKKIVTLSTAEKEYISLTECVKQRIQFINLFKEMTNKDIKIKIMVDRVDDSFFVNMT